MNKLRSNNKKFAYIKLRPIKCDLKFPKSEIKRQEYVQSIWNHLLNDELENHRSFVRNKKGTDKYMLTIWTDNRFTYLVQSIRSEMDTDVITIYMTPNTPDSVNDMIACAKMVHRNLNVMKKELVEAYRGAENIVYQDEERNDGQDHSA